MTVKPGKKAVLSFALAITTLQVSIPALAENGENARAIIGILGGIVGGVAIAQGGGRRGGNPGAIIAGAIAGSLIGSAIGNALEDDDRESCREAQERVLRSRGRGRQDWRGSNSYGNFSTVREGYNPRTGEYCREYRSEIYAGGRNEVQSGIACSRADGSYYEARSSEVSFNDDGPRGGFDRGDRRGPRDWNQGSNQEPLRPSPPPLQPVDNGPQSSARVSSITRRTGGEWIRLQFDRSVSLSEVQVTVLGAGMMIHEAVIYGVSGIKTPVRSFNETRTLYAGEVLNSGAINVRERVTTVDLRIESMGGSADAMFSVLAQDGRVNLSVSRY